MAQRGFPKIAKRMRGNTVLGADRAQRGRSMLRPYGRVGAAFAEVGSAAVGGAAGAPFRGHEGRRRWKGRGGGAHV